MLRQNTAESASLNLFDVCKDGVPSQGNDLTAVPFKREGTCMIRVLVRAGRGPVTVGLHIEVTVAHSADDVE